MSTGTAPTTANRFPHGWRYVRRVGPDGQTIFDQVPLTAQDVLHPQFGDVMPQSLEHDTDVGYLTGVARQRLAQDPTALVLSDVLIQWGLEGMGDHSPDLTVLRGLPPPVPTELSRFDVTAFGIRPRLLLEVVSPAYRDHDVVTKLEHYHRCQVPLYFLVDRERPGGPVRVLGYQYTRRRYHPIPADAEGWVWVEPLGLWLAGRGNRVVAFDGDTEEELGDYTAVTAQLQAERLAREKAEHQRDDERRRADNEKRRADDERRRADEETRLKLEALSEVEQLRARLKALLSP
jgi:Uma2 family endonuclease